MINTSVAYKNEIRGNRVMSLHDEYLFASSARLKLSANDFVKYNIDESTSEQSRFSIGAAVIKKYTATLNNETGKFDGFDFEGLDILARVGLKLPDGTTEILPKGRFRCVSAKTNENTIGVEAYDSMLFFDRPYGESSLSYPAKIREIIADACHMCGMTYDEKTVEQGDFLIEKRPEEKNMTFRDVISYCAQIMGCYAKIDTRDQLIFGWYDFDTLEKLRSGYDGGNFTDYTSGANLNGGNFTDYTSGALIDGGTFRDTWEYYHLYSLGSQSINTDDITITGICVIAEKGDGDEQESCLCGGEGYVLAIEKNPFLVSGARQGDKSSAQLVAEHISHKLLGKTIRPLSISCQSDPSIEAGDCICVTDRKQRTYFTVITNTTYVFGGAQKIECGAETPTENNYEKYSAATRLLEKADNETKKKISRYDIAVQHLTSLITQSFGVFKTEEALEDGSVIYYLHDKPDLSESRTIWKMTADAFAVSTDGGKTWNAGMDSSGNAVVNVLAAIGVNADWINTGTMRSIRIINGNEGEFSVDENGNLVATGARIVGNLSGSTITNGNGSFSVDENGTLVAANAHITGTIIGYNGYSLQYTDTTTRPNTKRDFVFVQSGFEDSQPWLVVKAPDGGDAIRIGTKFYATKPNGSKPYAVTAPIFDNGIYAEKAVINTLFQDYKEPGTITDEDGNFVTYHLRKSGAFACLYGTYGVKKHLSGATLSFPLYAFVEGNYYPTDHSVKTVGYKGKKYFAFEFGINGNLGIKNMSASDVNAESAINVTFRFDYFIF